MFYIIERMWLRISLYHSSSSACCRMCVTFSLDNNSSWLLKLDQKNRQYHLRLFILVRQTMLIWDKKQVGYKYLIMWRDTVFTHEVCIWYYVCYVQFGYCWCRRFNITVKFSTYLKNIFDEKTTLDAFLLYKIRESWSV